MNHSRVTWCFSTGIDAGVLEHNRWERISDVFAASLLAHSNALEPCLNADIS